MNISKIILLANNNKITEAKANKLIKENIQEVHTVHAVNLFNRGLITATELNKIIKKGEKQNDWRTSKK